MSSSRSSTAQRLLAALAGFGAGLLGLAPWLATGARLPLQNLWADPSALPDAMPHVLLPVSQYYASTILVLLVVGGAFAGLTLRVRRRGVALPFWPTLLGLLLAQGVALGQSFAVVGRGLGLGVEGGLADSRATLYYGGMLGGSIASVLLAVGVCALVARPARVPFALGVGLTAAPLASWLVLWLAAFSGPGMLPTIAGPIVRWLPAVVLGAALGYCGLVPARRALVWVVGLGLLWVLPAVLVAIDYGLGMRVLDGDLREMAAAARDVFPHVLRTTTAPAVVALVIGLAVVSGRRVLGRDSAREA